jgi:hypothetical protein
MLNQQQANCRKKRPFLSKGEALRHADEYRTRFLKHYEAYPCRVCGWWHLTTVTRGRSERRSDVIVVQRRIKLRFVTENRQRLADLRRRQT